MDLVERIKIALAPCGFKKVLVLNGDVKPFVETYQTAPGELRVDLGDVPSICEPIPRVTLVTNAVVFPIVWRYFECEEADVLVDEVVADAAAEFFSDVFRKDMPVAVWKHWQKDTRPYLTMKVKVVSEVGEVETLVTGPGFEYHVWVAGVPR